MKKRLMFAYLCVTAYVIFTGPSFFTGVSLSFWRALFVEQSSVGDVPDEVSEDEVVVETPEVEYVTIPDVPKEDRYLVDTSKRGEALTKAFALAMRPRVSARYTLVYSPHRPRYMTLLVNGAGENGIEQPIVVRIANISFAIEEKNTPQVAMR